MTNQPDNLLRRHFLSAAKSAFAEADGLNVVAHSGSKGRFREILAARLIKPVLPPDLEIGTGLLISSTGAQSPQVDLILYARRVLPPALFNATEGLFPIESCFYSIEVKSMLSAQSLGQAVANARIIQALPSVPTEHWTPWPTDGSWVGKKEYGTPSPIQALFAFSSDLVADPMEELARYRRIDAIGDKARPAFQVICIRGRGYWYFGQSNRWKYKSSSESLDEVMYFLAGLANTVPQLTVVKGRPRFGKYLTSEENFIVVE